MNELEYMRKLNKNTMICYAILTVAALISFIIDFPQSALAGLIGITLMCLAFAVSFVWSLILYHKEPQTRYVKYITSGGYVLTYFALTCLSDNVANYVYIFPMLCILLVYCNIRFMGLLCLIALLFNIMSTIFHATGFQTVTGSDIGHMITQLISILLIGTFCNRSVSLLAVKDNIFTDAIDTKYEDSLTGLRNVRFIDDSRDNRFNVRKNPKLSVAFIDIDNFKQFNTDYGHTGGDLVLKSVATTFLKNIAEIPHTYAIRNGGDEFLIVSRTMQAKAFIGMVEKCRKDISFTPYPFLHADARITISIGIACRELDMSLKSFQEVYDKADERNHMAKDSGKNKIVWKDS